MLTHGLSTCLAAHTDPTHRPAPFTHPLQAYETADGKLDTKKREAALLARYQEVGMWVRGLEGASGWLRWCIVVWFVGERNIVWFVGERKC